MRITEHMWIVASGSAGFGISNAYDCTVYLVDCGNGYLLIDAGAGLDTPWILDNIRTAGFDPDRCVGILVTHAHADHAGGAKELSEATSAQVYADVQAADYISRGDTEAIALPAAIAAGVYPESYHFFACPASAVQDGQKLVFGDVSLTAVSTPGHCSGHMAYLAEVDGIKALFAGDCIYPGGYISLQPIWDCSIPEYVDTVSRLAQLDFDALLPSHHGLLLAGGKSPVLKAKEYFDKLAMPPGI